MKVSELRFACGENILSGKVLVKKTLAIICVIIFIVFILVHNFQLFFVAQKF
jgi:hypothetical protein